MESSDDTLRHRLRSETRAAHAALEAALPMSGHDPQKSDYLDHLRFLVGFHEPVEEGLRRVPGLGRMLPDLDRRWKTSLLRGDLGPLADGPRAPREQVPAPRSIPQALGVLYVLEGATLGARTLLPKLRQEGIVPGSVGSAYVTGYGAETAAMWAGMCRALDRVAADRADEVVAWAGATFTALRAWRREWELLR